MVRADFNSYGSRRGHHEVMIRGAFANVRVRNLMLPPKAAGRLSRVGRYALGAHRGDLGSRVRRQGVLAGAGRGGRRHETPTVAQEQEVLQPVFEPAGRGRLLPVPAAVPSDWRNGYNLRER